MRPGRCALGLMLLAAGVVSGVLVIMPGCMSWRSLTRTRSSGHDHRMPVPLFDHKPERCPYGHSLAPGMPQKISWMPCICEPAREAESWFAVTANKKTCNDSCFEEAADSPASRYLRVRRGRPSRRQSEGVS